jgi:hypothetical protein
MNKKRDFGWMVPTLIAAILCGFTGAYLQSSHDGTKMDKDRVSTAIEIQKVKYIATEEKKYLEAIIQDQKDRHARADQQQLNHFSSFASNAKRMRFQLETELSSARTNGQNCTSRIAGIADTLGGVFDAIGEVTDVAQELEQQNGRLKTENRKLTDQVGPLLEYYKQTHPEHITVVGTKDRK